MKVRRISPVCQVTETDGTAQVKYKGQMVTVQARYRVHIPTGGDSYFKDLSGFEILQQNPLMVRQKLPIEEAIQWNKHGDHPTVRPLKPEDHFHKKLVEAGKNPDHHGIMINHAGHDNDIYPGDFVVGNKGCEIRRYQSDMTHYEIVE